MFDIAQPAAICYFCEEQYSFFSTADLQQNSTYILEESSHLYRPILRHRLQFIVRISHLTVITALNV
jgi:hypothetical protein